MPAKGGLSGKRTQGTWKIDAPVPARELGDLQLQLWHGCQQELLALDLFLQPPHLLGQ